MVGLRVHEASDEKESQHFHTRMWVMQRIWFLAFPFVYASLQLVCLLYLPMFLEERWKVCGSHRTARLNKLAVCLWQCWSKHNLSIFREVHVDAEAKVYDFVENTASNLGKQDDS